MLPFQTNQGNYQPMDTICYPYNALRQVYQMAKVPQPLRPQMPMNPVQVPQVFPGPQVSAMAPLHVGHVPGINPMSFVNSSLPDPMMVQRALQQRYQEEQAYYAACMNQQGGHWEFSPSQQMAETLPRPSAPTQKCFAPKPHQAAPKMDALFTFLQDACDLAEKIATRNQHHPCFRNINDLCIRTKSMIRSPYMTLSNVQSQGTPWITKDFICALMRLIGCSYLMRGYLHAPESLLASIGQEFTNDFRACYAHWEEATRGLCEHIIRIFTNVDNSVNSSQSGESPDPNDSASSPETAPIVNDHKASEEHTDANGNELAATRRGSGDTVGTTGQPGDDDAVINEVIPTASEIFAFLDDQDEQGEQAIDVDGLTVWKSAIKASNKIIRPKMHYLPNIHSGGDWDVWTLQDDELGDQTGEWPRSQGVRVSQPWPQPQMAQTPAPVLAQPTAPPQDLEDVSTRNIRLLQTLRAAIRQSALFETLQNPTPGLIDCRNNLNGILAFRYSLVADMIRDLRRVVSDAHDTCDNDPLVLKEIAMFTALINEFE